MFIAFWMRENIRIHSTIHEKSTAHERELGVFFRTAYFFIISLFRA